VPGNLAAAVDINNLSTIGWSLGIFSALSSGIGTHVLEQNTGIRSCSSSNFFVDGALKSQPIKVWHKLRVKTRI
jgi:hypothetical protein